MGATRPDDLKHMVLHFTKGKAWRDASVPIYVRGDGCHLWDENGRRYLDGLAGLFVVQIGHGRSDLAHAAAKQMEQLAYTPSWAATHPPAIEASKLVTSLAPGDLDAVFWVTSGSEAVESAIKFTRQYHRSQGNPEKTKVISRRLSYHGTTMGALSATGLDSIREPFLPLLGGFLKVDSTLGATDGVAAAEQFEEAILAAGPETVGMIIAEPVQNGGGALVPPPGYWQELRRICDKYNVLLTADEVINSFGRLGHWFGSEMVGVVPDMLTFAKGATSGYAPVGGVLIRRQRVDELLDSANGTFTHGATWGGHPVSMAVTIANVTAMRDEGVLDNVQEHAGYFRDQLDAIAASHDNVSEVRGTGYFYAVELTVSRDRGIDLTDDQTVRLVNEHLPRMIQDAGLLIRADNRGKAKLMLSPPLIAKTEELDELIAGVDQVVSRAAEVHAV
ncbi:MAG: aminotransferase class III-fold pyridoxal phosphate-dependent enzyme [bacterium]|nr:aminotransferase class III-fold pyridoxal phosphate-dependent enzyme [bacterium]